MARIVSDYPLLFPRPNKSDQHCVEQVWAAVASFTSSSSLYSFLYSALCSSLYRPCSLWPRVKIVSSSGNVFIAGSQGGNVDSYLERFWPWENATTHVTRREFHKSAAELEQAKVTNGAIRLRAIFHFISWLCSSLKWWLLIIMMAMVESVTIFPTQPNIWSVP